MQVFKDRIDTIRRRFANLVSGEMEHSPASPFQVGVLACILFDNARNAVPIDAIRLYGEHLPGEGKVKCPGLNSVLAIECDTAQEQFVRDRLLYRGQAIVPIARPATVSPGIDSEPLHNEHLAAVGTHFLNMTAMFQVAFMGAVDLCNAWLCIERDSTARAFALFMVFIQRVVASRDCGSTDCTAFYRATYRLVFPSSRDRERLFAYRTNDGYAFVSIMAGARTVYPFAFAGLILFYVEHFAAALARSLDRSATIIRGMFSYCICFVASLATEMVLRKCECAWGGFIFFAAVLTDACDALAPGLIATVLAAETPFAGCMEWLAAELTCLFRHRKILLTKDGDKLNGGGRPVVRAGFSRWSAIPSLSPLTV